MAEPTFHVEVRGERVEGMAAGIDRRHLERLRRGEPEPEWEIDLHGLDQREARQAVRRAVLEAFEAGVRCLLVIHGRGSHSEAGAVLKPALARWLEAPPAGLRVMAFCSAASRDGGAGASYVLLRRNRSLQHS